jgi:hypothetical protein
MLLTAIEAGFRFRRCHAAAIRCHAVSLLLLLTPCHYFDAFSLLLFRCCQRQMPPLFSPPFRYYCHYAFAIIDIFHYAVTPLVFH